LPDSLSPNTTFKRVLSLWTLVLFGLAFVGPTAPFTFFGIGSVKSHGHFTLVYLIAMLAVSFTALSYGRMAAAFPEAGSIYSYAAHGIHPLAGFFSGWIVMLDYVLLPLLSVIIIAASLNSVIPALPYSVYVLLCAALMTGVNLSGMKTTALATLIFNLVLAAAILWFVVAALKWLYLRPLPVPSDYFIPFFNSRTFQLTAVMAATPIAVLSFLGFDGISTLAEDTKDPARNIGRATLLVCLIAGLIFVLLTWLGQLIWPDYRTLTNLETAFAQIGRLIGGSHLYYVIAALVVAQAWASGITSQASSSRLLYAMGRDGRLPPRFFGYLHPVRSTPTYTLLLLGALACVGALLINLDQAAQLVNFGACIAFMMVNVSVFAHYYLQRGERSGIHVCLNLIAPLIGFLICFYIWLSISKLAMLVGFAWSIVGALYCRYGSQNLSPGEQLAVKG
jgi:putrescine importer